MENEKSREILEIKKEMNQKSGSIINFIKSDREPEIKSDRAYYFIFSDNDILVLLDSKDSLDQGSIPCVSEKTLARMSLEGVRFFGRYNDTDCYCARIQPENLSGNFRLINRDLLHPPLQANGHQDPRKFATLPLGERAAVSAVSLPLLIQEYLTYFED